MDMKSLEVWTTIAANVATAFGILGFAFFYFSHQQSQRQFKVSVMLSCIDRFQKLFPIIRGDEDDKNRIKRYVDLTNEEFFYFQQGYIPKQVIVEWMDSVIDFLPVYRTGQNLPINYNVLQPRAIHDEQMLNDYPRLLKALRMEENQMVTTKGDLIKHVCGNLGIRITDKYLNAALIDF